MFSQMDGVGPQAGGGQDRQAGPGLGPWGCDSMGTGSSSAGREGRAGSGSQLCCHQPGPSPTLILLPYATPCPPAVPSFPPAGGDSGLDSMEIP